MMIMTANYCCLKIMIQTYGKQEIFLGGPVPPLYTGFPGVRAYVHVRKLMEAESAMTMKIKVSSMYE